MSTGKVIILKDMGEGADSLDISTMNKMAQDLSATIIHLPVKYDLARIGLSGLIELRANIDAEIKRMKLLKKLEESK